MTNLPGERLIQYATENLVTEVLIHPQTNTLLQCIRNLLASFTKHRHIIHAGYTFGGNGSWILQVRYRPYREIPCSSDSHGTDAELNALRIIFDCRLINLIIINFFIKLRNSIFHIEPVLYNFFLIISFIVFFRMEPLVSRTSSMRSASMKCKGSFELTRTVLP